MTPNEPQVGNTPTASKPIKLTTAQGCLLLAVLGVVFFAFFLFVSFRNAQSLEGRVTGDGIALEAWSCSSDRVNDELIVSLRDDPPKEGFHIENRALLLRDGSGSSGTRAGKPPENLQISYRDQDRQVSPLDCVIEAQDLIIKTVSRRSGAPGRRIVDNWSGTLSANCTSHILGDMKIELEMKNCD